MVTSNTVLYLRLLTKCGGELSREVSSAEKGALKDPQGWECSASALTGEACVCPAKRDKLNCSVFKNRKQLILGNQGLGH